MLIIDRFDTHGRHGYTIKDETGRVLATDLPGITTILNVIDKSGGLVPWASRLAADYFKDQLRSAISLDYRAEALAYLLDVDGYKLTTEQRDAAGARGTDVHELCAEIAAGTKPEDLPIGDLPDDQRSIVRAFCRWLERTRPRVTSIERRLACVQCGYGATTDLELMLYGQAWILDLKTSNTLQDTMALQLTAQAHARVYTETQRCEPVEGVLDCRLGVLWLGAPPNGGKKRKEYPKDGCELVELREDFGALQACLTAYRWRREGKWKA